MIRRCDYFVLFVFVHVFLLIRLPAVVSRYGGSGVFECTFC